MNHHLKTYVVIYVWKYIFILWCLNNSLPHIYVCTCSVTMYINNYEANVTLTILHCSTWAYRPVTVITNEPSTMGIYCIDIHLCIRKYIYLFMFRQNYLHMYWITCVYVYVLMIISKDVTLYYCWSEPTQEPVTVKFYRWTTL
jgi:hypothetical protein